MLVWEAPAPAGPAQVTGWMLTDSGVAGTRPRAGEPLVFPVEKVANSKNPFAMGVTVGRVESNDVVVDDSSVSRFHAWLQYDDKVKAWFVTDAESRNGTFLDGVMLIAKKRAQVKDGATLRFGEASMRFMLSETFLKYAETAWSRPVEP